MKRLALLIPLILLAVGCGGNSHAQTRPMIQPHPAGRQPINRTFGTAANPTVGEMLTTTNGTWTNSPTSYAYQWQDCTGGVCTNISAATSSSYTVQSSDLGDQIDVIVTASNAAGSASQTSAPTGIVTSGGSDPANTASPAVIDTTLLNNFEEPDTVQASAGAWTNTPTGYTYQFQDCTGISGSTGTGCTNIGSPQCSATSATTCTYALTTGDEGDYIVAAVTATNGSGSSSPAASSAEGTVVASRINQPCNNTTALTDYLDGPHLCGWPDATNVGYLNAPGYPGSLTTASSGSPTCPTTPTSNHTYSFCQYAGLSLPSSLTNVTFYGDDFFRTNPQNPNVSGSTGDNNIVFDYDTFQPAISYPGAPTGTGSCPTNLGSTAWQSCGSLVTCAQSYQYGIYNENGAMKGYTVEHSWFWGFGNAIDTAGSTQANPQIFEYNFFSDSETLSGCGYHNDGIGNLNSGTEDYATVDHNTFNFTGNTNQIAWQQGNYDHLTNTNNLMDGDNASYAGARSGGAFTATNIATTGNIFDAYLPHATGNYPTDLTGSYWTTTGSTWNHNYWMVPPGASSVNSAGTSSSAPGTHNGEFILPNNHSSGFPNDCGWVSATDYPNTTTDC